MSDLAGRATTWFPRSEPACGCRCTAHLVQVWSDCLWAAACGRATGNPGQRWEHAFL